ncbi:Ionotropic receptor 7c [Carabus blaptoides fortunei]
MFPKKIPLDLHGCEIKVVANIADPYVMDANLTTEDAREIGIEAVVFRNILRKMNLTQNLITTTYLAYSYRFPNGTVIGTHEYLSKGECDLVYGQKWNAIFLSEVFDNTYVHYTDSFTWHVPAALPDELLNSPLEILLVPNIVQSLQQSQISRDLAVLKKGHMIPLKDMADISMKPANGIAFFGAVCRTKYVMRKLYSSPDGKPKVYMIKPSFHAVTLTMHMVRGFPLLDRMNDIIFRSIAAGFHAKWMNDVEAPTIMEQSELRPLRAGDFRGAYIILALGYLCAILCYMVELKLFVNNN